MQIEKINNYNTNNCKKFNNILFKGIRVDKGMTRFCEVNMDRMPKTMQDFISLLPNLSDIKPIEAQKKAFGKLIDAVSVDGIKKDFSKEPLFKELEDSNDTKATNGILGIFREYKELFPNGILNSGEELTLYLVKKIFLEAKMIDEINCDLDNDLVADIKDEFVRRYNNKNYVHSSTLKALGIKLPDTAYINSLKFTREGYSDQFGLKVSQGQLAYWNSLSEEERFDILSKRCEGRDNWWNSLSHEERLNLVVGIDSDEDLYKNYKRFINAQRRHIKANEEHVSTEQICSGLTKRIAIGTAKLKDKDIFVLWMQKNISKYYDSLSEADKDTVHIKRVRRLAVRWQEMTPAERTELIEKMRTGREPLRYAMIDAWNHSANIIRELSEFLKSKQILKPVDLLYATEEFSEFQSKIMTEFWSLHPEFAEQLGENIKKSQEKVENSIINGLFEDLKKEIIRDKQYRIKQFERERSAKIISEQRNVQNIKEYNNYRDEFIDLYTKNMKSKGFLPVTYIKDMAELLPKFMPEKFIRDYINAIKSNDTDAQYAISRELNNIDHKISPEFMRIAHAIESALASELSSKSHNYSYFGGNFNELINAASSISLFGHNSEKLNVKRIEKLYEEYKKELNNSELTDIVYHYFISNSKNDHTHAELSTIKDYIATYGRSAYILFSNQSAYSIEAKEAFNKKFVNNMTNEVLKDNIYFLEYDNAFKLESKINKILNRYKKQKDYLPKEFVEKLTQEWAYMFRWADVAKMAEINTNDEETKYLQLYTPEIFERFVINKELYHGKRLMITPLRSMMFYPRKIELLAMEQAFADELYRISGNDIVYKMLFEDLSDATEELLKKKFYKNIEYKFPNINLNVEPLIIKERININNIKNNYRNYLDNLNKVYEYHNPDYELTQEDIIYSLNPDESRTELDEYLKEKLINFYDIFE